MAAFGKRAYYVFNLPLVGLLLPIICLNSNLAFAKDRKNQDRVILIVLDGVRGEDIEEALPQIDAAFAGLSDHKRFFIGPNTDLKMETGNQFQVSLTGYQDMMAGRPQGCRSNACGRVDRRALPNGETLPEGLARFYALPAERVAIFSSWAFVKMAVRSYDDSSIFTNTGLEEYSLPKGGEKEIGYFVEAFNRAQFDDKPHWYRRFFNESRFDSYTQEVSLVHLEHYKPDFLFVALGDADERGHSYDDEGYKRALASYWEYFADLTDVLLRLEDDDKRTTILITADHGRGLEEEWGDHKNIDAAKHIWLYALYSWEPIILSDVDPQESYTLHDIRATIENIQNIPTVSCSDCGRGIPQLMPNPPALFNNMPTMTISIENR